MTAIVLLMQKNVGCDEIHLSKCTLFYFVKKREKKVFSTIKLLKNLHLENS